MLPLNRISTLDFCGQTRSQSFSNAETTTAILFNKIITYIDLFGSNRYKYIIVGFIGRNSHTLNINFQIFLYQLKVRAFLVFLVLRTPNDPFGRYHLLL